MKTTTLRLLENPLLTPVKITPLYSTLRSHTLIVSNCCCHDRSISEPAAIKIIWLRARARYYCWRASFGPRATCCRTLFYRVILRMLYGGYFIYVICAAAIFPTCSQQHVCGCIGNIKSRYLLCHSSTIADLFRQDQIH